MKQVVSWVIMFLGKKSCRSWDKMQNGWNFLREKVSTNTFLLHMELNMNLNVTVVWAVLDNIKKIHSFKQAEKLSSFDRSFI